MIRDQDVLAALARQDIDALIAMIDQGRDANWSDDRGQSLLHFAAMQGHADFCRRLMDKGASARNRNEYGETPAETAAIFGYPEVAALLADAAAQLPAAPLAHDSLAALRAAGVPAARNAFFDAVQAGQLADIVALSRRTGEPITAADLLQPAYRLKGMGGMTALAKICERGELPLLLQADLWMGRMAEVTGIWEQVPAACRKTVDFAAFSARLHQHDLQSKAAQDRRKLKLPGRKP